MKVPRIIGIGTDIVEVSRMMRILEKPSRNRFLEKVLHPREIEELNSKDLIEAQS